MSEREDLDPKVWGSWFWLSMYSVAYSYPEKALPKEIKAAKEYYLSLQKLLPCENCREEYTKVCKQTKITSYLRSKKELLLSNNALLVIKEFLNNSC